MTACTKPFSTMLASVFVLFLVIHTAVGRNDDDCYGKEYSCYSCSQVQICNKTPAGFRELFRVTCQGKTPFCDEHTGSCSFLPSSACATIDNYPCLRDGVFPNPTDCGYYRKCKGGESKSYHCTPSGNHFDVNTGGCRQGANCRTINCKDKNGVKVPHPDNAQYFAYCIENKAAFVDKCPGVYELNTETQKCSPTCRAVGDKIPDHSNCTKYYYCTKSPSTRVYTVNSISCPLGFGFDPLFLKCSPLFSLPSCSSRPLPM